MAPIRFDSHFVLRGSVARERVVSRAGVLNWSACIFGRMSVRLRKSVRDALLDASRRVCGTG